MTEHCGFQFEDRTSESFFKIGTHLNHNTGNRVVAIPVKITFTASLPLSRPVTSTGVLAIFKIDLLYLLIFTYIFFDV